MPLGTLVVGVGGVGKGVINWVKRFVENEGDGSENIKFVCIDSTAQEDWYAFHSERKFYIDFSSEFCPLNQDPTPVYASIRKGEEYPFIGEWLSQEDAKQSPDNTIKPEGGLGQNRPAGRAVFFLTADSIYGKIAQAFDEMVGRYERQENISVGGENILWDVFVVGSPTGGTGSGCFIDTSNLVRKIINERGLRGVKLYGVVALPECFNSVFNDTKEILFKDARSFAFYRENARMMYAGWNPISIEYNNALFLENNFVFDFCFLVNGINDRVKLGSNAPMYGICPTIADFIWVTVKDRASTIHQVFRNDTTKISEVDESYRFSTFGITKFEFPYMDIVETFRYRLVNDIMSCLIRDDPNSSAGENEADLFFRQLKFTENIANYNRLQEVKISPPNSKEGFSHLIDMINCFKTNVPGKDVPFPNTGNHPVLKIQEVVDYTTSFFKRVINEDVINQCESELQQYLGSSAGANTYTVRGWIKSQKGLLLQIFESNLFEKVKGIFFDSGKNEFKKLSTAEPNILMIGFRFLKRVQESCKNFFDFMQKSLEEYTKNSPVDGQNKKVDKLKNKMLEKREETDKRVQQEFLREYQKLIELRVWFEFLQEYKNIANEMSRIAEKFWLLFGDPAEGWVNTISKAKDDSQKKYNDMLTFRRMLQNVPTIKQYPELGGKGEEKLYNRHVNDKGYLKEILGKMSWVFVMGKMPGIYELQLTVPEKLEQNATDAALTYVFSGTRIWAKVAEFDIKKFYEFTSTFLSEELRRVDLWTAIAYDYDPNSGLTPEKFAENQYDVIGESSKSLLSTKQRVSLEPYDARYCLSKFVSPPYPKETFEKIGKTFHDRFGRSAILEQSLERAAISLSISHKIPYLNWSGFEDYYKNYLGYFKRGGKIPVHIFPEERNASKLEKTLTRALPLAPKVVSVLKSMSDLRVFTLAYLFGILDGFEKKVNEKGDSTAPPHYVIEGENANGTPVSDGIDLGKINDILSVLKEYMKKDNEDARFIINSKLSEYLNSLPDKKRAVAALLNSVNKLNLNLGDNLRELEKRELENDMKDVFKAVINQVLKDM